MSRWWLCVALAAGCESVPTSLVVAPTDGPPEGDPSDGETDAAPACVVTSWPADTAGKVGTRVVLSVEYQGPCEFSWTLASLPSGSVLTREDLADGSTDHPSFLPDVPGRYVLAGVAYDGVVWGPLDYVAVDVSAPDGSARSR